MLQTRNTGITTWINKSYQIYLLVCTWPHSFHSSCIYLAPLFDYKKRVGLSFLYYNSLQYIMKIMPLFLKVFIGFLFPLVMERLHGQITGNMRFFWFNVISSIQFLRHPTGIKNPVIIQTSKRSCLSTYCPLSLKCSFHTPLCPELTIGSALTGYS